MEVAKYLIVIQITYNSNAHPYLCTVININ